MIAYLRVSSEEQGASGAGLDAQRAAIERSGVPVRSWEQDVLSGSTTERPALQRALTACQHGAEGIVVAKLDRLSRSVIDFGQLLERSRKEGWNIIALDFGLDLSTPQGELVANVLMSVAQWERKMIGLRTKEALAVRKAQGVRLGRPRTIPDAVRTEALRLREAGVSPSVIAEQLPISRASVYLLARP